MAEADRPRPRCGAGVVRLPVPRPPAGRVQGRGQAARAGGRPPGAQGRARARRSEEHTSELQSLMRISYAVFCLNKKNQRQIKNTNNDTTSKNTLTRTPKAM